MEMHGTNVKKNK